MFISHLAVAWMFHCAIASLSTVIRMPRSSYVFPIQYIPVEGNGTLNGSAIFQVYFSSFGFPLRGSSERFRNCSEFFQARGIVGGNEYRRMLDFDTPLMVPLNSDRPLRLPAGPNVESGQGMDCFRASFLLCPVSDTEDVLIINPSNPSRYAYEGLIFYTPIEVFESPTGPTNRWPIRTAARLMGGDSLTSQPLTSNDFMRTAFIFYTEDDDDGYLSLPLRLRNEFLSRIVALGIHISRDPDDPFAFNLHDIDSDRLITLPSFEIIIRTEDRSFVRIALVESTDYMIPTEQVSVYGVIFSSHEGIFTLCSRIHRSLLIHFDYENNRIGFADPLVEL